MSAEIVRKDVSIPELGILAHLHERVDGGPMRTALDASPKSRVGWYSSHKNGGSLFYESQNERHAFYWPEVSSEVVSYRSQPHRLELGIGRFYTPDREDIRDDGGIQIVEVKGVYKASRDPQYHAKLAAARLIYERLGWRFIILEQQRFEQKPSFPLVEAIQRYRSTSITTTDEDAVLSSLRKHGELRYGTLCNLWERAELGAAKLCALIVKRSIVIDLSASCLEEASVRIGDIKIRG